MTFALALGHVPGVAAPALPELVGNWQRALGMTLLFVAVGFLFVGLGIPLLRRRVPPNSLYGLRIAATVQDERVWYEANARFGRDWLVLGLVQVAFALTLSSFLDPRDDRYALANVAFLMLGTVATTVAGAVRATRISRKLGPG